MERRAVLEIMVADERRVSEWVMMLIVNVLSPSYMISKAIPRRLCSITVELVGTSCEIQVEQ
jgi:hypothetical protein